MGQVFNIIMSEDLEILPTILVIHPSGYTEFLDADMNAMSSSEIASVLDAEDIEIVHFSKHLSAITQECGLVKNLAMYFDRNAPAKGLESNYVGNMLYDGEYDVGGAIIIALEDNERNSSSFENEEDIENVFEAIDDLTDILRRETDDNGQYDAWA